MKRTMHEPFLSETPLTVRDAAAVAKALGFNAAPGLGDLTDEQKATQDERLALYTRSGSPYRTNPPKKATAR